MLQFSTWFGSFLYDKEEVISVRLFPKDAAKIAVRLSAMEDGEILDEEKELAEGHEGFHVVDGRLSVLGGEYIEEDIPDIEPAEYGFSDDLLHEAMMIRAREQAMSRISPDETITQAANAMDDLAQSANLLSERLHEWYDLCFPGKEVPAKEEEFLILVIQLSDKTGENEHLPLSELAETLQNIYGKKDELESFISREMESTARNLSTLAGPVIGARLIAKAGGLEKLSRLPSGTIQMLGAEKALFRHLKDGSKPPKHGLIFQHPLIHRAPYWQRGKIARAFASKIAIAAKVDEHSDRFIGDDLKKDLLDRIDDIRKKYPTPESKHRGKSRK
jgi:nucleolar protein 56